LKIDLERIVSRAKCLKKNKKNFSHNTPPTKHRTTHIQLHNIPTAEQMQCARPLLSSTKETFFGRQSQQTPTKSIAAFLVKLQQQHSHTRPISRPALVALALISHKTGCSTK